MSLIKAFFPVVVATSQALAGPAISTEPLDDTPIVAPLVQNAHTTANARASLADWKKRLHEARSGVTIGTVQAMRLEQPHVMQPL